MSQTPIQSSTEPAGPWIQTHSGTRFYASSPTFRIDDIAHALGMQCRYAGHTRYFYSVAEHSVIVSLLMEELKLGDPMEGLLHDAHEAYMIDMPRPWKQIIPDYHKVEKEVEHAMREHFYLPTSATHGCKQADQLALFIESWYLMPCRGESYGEWDPEGYRPKAIKLCDAGWRTLNLYPEEATKRFLERYEALLP
jgi:5'-deoxynucleotidase YfbR-like HD superfamily hydrolase